MFNVINSMVQIPVDSPSYFTISQFKCIVTFSDMRAHFYIGFMFIRVHVCLRMYEYICMCASSFMSINMHLCEVNLGCSLHETFILLIGPCLSLAWSSLSVFISYTVNNRD